MKELRKSTRVLKRIMQAAPFVMMGICLVLYFVCFRHITLEQLLKFTPDNIFLAALLIIGMFALKSLSFFFPMLLLELVSGSIAPNFFVALLINIIGTFVMTNIPYFIGRFAEREFVEGLISKNKKMTAIKELQMNNEFFFAYFLRVINMLPYDVVSLYLGSSGCRWSSYVLGSMLGTLPGTICSTLLGDSISDITSPQFIVSVAVNAVFSIASGLFYIYYVKKRKHNNSD